MIRAALSLFVQPGPRQSGNRSFDEARFDMAASPQPGCSRRQNITVPRQVNIPAGNGSDSAKCPLARGIRLICSKFGNLGKLAGVEIELRDEKGLTAAAYLWGLTVGRQTMASTLYPDAWEASGHLTTQRGARSTGIGGQGNEPVGDTLSELAKGFA